MWHFLLCYITAAPALLSLHCPGCKQSQGFGMCVCFWLQSAVFSADQMLISDWEHNQGGWGGEEEATLDPTETTNLISHPRQLASTHLVRVAVLLCKM